MNEQAAATVEANAKLARGVMAFRNVPLKTLQRFDELITQWRDHHNAARYVQATQALDELAQAVPAMAPALALYQAASLGGTVGRVINTIRR